MAIRLKVLYFGQARDATGTASEELSFTETPSVRDLFEELEGRHSRLAKLRKTTRIAVNAELAKDDLRLEDGDEVAFLPPVAGG